MHDDNLFDGVQKFGQEFLKKLKGKRLPNKLLEKVEYTVLGPLPFLKKLLNYYTN